MVMDAVPPYAPSLRWYGFWYGCRLRGLSDEEAVAYANRKCEINGKEFARTTLHCGEGNMTLSVAVEGGSSGLRRRGVEKRARVSLHGRWPHVHLGALEAAYGRAPYYQHVMPGIRKILDNVATGDTLETLNKTFHEWLAGFLTSDVESPSLTSEAIRKRGQEIASGLDPDLSLIDSLMLHGPETSLALLCYT